MKHLLEFLKKLEGKQFLISLSLNYGCEGNKPRKGVPPEAIVKGFFSGEVWTFF